MFFQAMDFGCLAVCVERKGKEHIVKDDIGGFAMLDVI